MDIYELSDYRQVIRKSLLDRKAINKEFTYQAMAKACRVTKTYLSRVLSGGGELNEDQLYRATEFLHLGPDEKRFLNLLHAFQRSVDKRRRAELKAQVEQIRAQARTTEKHIDAVVHSDSSDGFAEYFLNPLSQVIHMFLHVQHYQNDPRRIGRELKISSRLLDRTLRLLQKLDLIHVTDGHYLPKKDQFRHLSKESPLYTGYRALLRLKALEILDRDDDANQYSFSVLFAADPRARSQIHAEFLTFLSKVENIVKSAETNAVYQMNFDLLGWSQE